MSWITLLLTCGCIHAVNSAANCGPNGNANCELRCQNTSLTSAAPTQTATACADTRRDCQSIFNCATDAAACDVPGTYVAFVLGTPATYPKYRAMLCDLPSMSDIAIQCARTCQICCETSSYNCLDDTTGVVNCAANRAKCTDPSWTNIMASYCPNTCGLCANGTCRDLISGCATLRSLCYNVDFVTFMRANCDRTCSDGRCPAAVTTASSCSNLASNCAANSGLCTNSLYRTLMLQQCCATCSGTASATTCVNANSNCASWVSNGFCSSSFYTSAQKRQYCASSCGLCLTG